jgi:hypothetical protein
LRWPQRNLSKQVNLFKWFLFSVLTAFPTPQSAKGIDTSKHSKPNPEIQIHLSPFSVVHNPFFLSCVYSWIYLKILPEIILGF